MNNDKIIEQLANIFGGVREAGAAVRESSVPLEKRLGEMVGVLTDVANELHDINNEIASVEGAVIQARAALTAALLTGGAAWPEGMKKWGGPPTIEQLKHAVDELLIRVVAPQLQTAEQPPTSGPAT